jgi:hypothetical protein
MSLAKLPMLTRVLFATAFALAACATAPTPPAAVEVHPVPGEPRALTLLVDKETSFRLSRVGVMDSSSPSALTDRVRFRAALEEFTAHVLAERGLCREGFTALAWSPAPPPHGLAITVTCQAPAG